MCLKVSGVWGFAQPRWGALLGYWEAVCRHGPCGPLSSLHPWDDWIPPDLHGFYKWVFDSLEVLSGFLKQVVVSRRDVGIRKWTRWLREDSSSRPYVWLLPDFVPPSTFLVVRNPHIDAEFREAWMPFFCRSGHPVVTSWILLDISCLKSLIWIFLGLLVAICKRWLVLRSLLLGVCMGGLGMRLRHCRYLDFLVWQFSWNWLRILVLGLRVFLMLFLL